MEKNNFILSLLLIALSTSVGAQEEDFKSYMQKDLAHEVNQGLSAPRSGCEIAPKGAIPNFRSSLMDNFTKLGGDPTALKQALCFFDKHKSTNFKAVGDPSRSKGIKIDNQRYITINDLNKDVFQSRMFILDLETGMVKAYHSMHGVGGQKGVAESDFMAREFSNKDGSYATPRGFMITGSRINYSSDSRWKFSMKLHGIQSGVNDNTFLRAVIMHPFPGVSNEIASSEDSNPVLENNGNYVLSLGCTMLGPEVASDVINQLKATNANTGGSLYYNYTPTEKSRGDNYCGEENLLVKKPSN